MIIISGAYDPVCYAFSLQIGNDRNDKFLHIRIDGQDLGGFKKKLSNEELEVLIEYLTEDLETNQQQQEEESSE